MLKKILQWLTNYLADILNKVIAGVILLCLSASAWTIWSRSLLQTPIPLWIVILIVLAILSCCAILFLMYYQHSSALPYKIKYFIVNDQKWKTKIYDSGYYEVDDNPICKNHNLPFVGGSHNIFCPEARNRNCKNIIFHEDRHDTYEIAKSYIDKKIRNKEYS